MGTVLHSVLYFLFRPKFYPKPGRRSPVSIPTTRQQRQRLKAENKKWPKKLTEIPKDSLPVDHTTNRLRVWRSCDFLVQEFDEKNGVRRLSVNKTTETKAKPEIWRDISSICITRAWITHPSQMIILDENNFLKGRKEENYAASTNGRIPKPRANARACSAPGYAATNLA